MTLRRHDHNLGIDEFAGVVDYAPARVGRRRFVPSARGLQLLLTIGSLPALVVPFLDFDFGTSPLDTIVEKRGLLAVIGCGFFVPYLFFAWKLRLTLLIYPSRRELRAAAVLSWLSILPALVALFALVSLPFERSMNPWNNWNEIMIDLAMALVGIFICVAGLWLARRINRHLGSADAIAARLLVTYVTVAACCLMAFFPTRYIGYRLTVAVVLIFTTEFIVMASGTGVIHRSTPGEASPG
jgi:hypothetical protein